MKAKKSTVIFVIVVIVMIAIALKLPTGFEKPEFYNNIERVKARVLEVDDSNVFATGVLKVGHEILKIEILEGKSKGVVLDDVNNGLSGKLEQDKFFAAGDKLLLTIKYDDSGTEILFTNVVDHYRIDIELILAVIYMGTLIALAGWTGFKAILSFTFSVVFIWKIMIPAMLKGYNPIVVALAIVSLLSFIVIFLVTGFTAKGLTAFAGSVLGIATTCILSQIFGNKFMVDGSVMPYAEALFYAGHIQIDLTQILYSSIFISSAGAVTDIAMDIASVQDELKVKLPEIKMGELIGSGITVSRTLVSTMTTTLLLAYSGSYMTTMMTFVANGIPLVNVLNIRYVASEILTTLVGSFGLVLVAPFTAIAGGIVYCGGLRRLPLVR